jgi:hypothetical protein
VKFFTGVQKRFQTWPTLLTLFFPSSNTLCSQLAWTPIQAQLKRLNPASPASENRFIPAHKENKHEAGRAKKLAEAQETKEAPCYEEVHSGEEIKGGGRVKIEETPQSGIIL